MEFSLELAAYGTTKALIWHFRGHKDKIGLFPRLQQSGYYHFFEVKGESSPPLFSGLELRALIENMSLIKTDTYTLYCYPVTNWSTVAKRYWWDGMRGDVRR